MTGLPRRSFSPEPLPPDGLAAVRREATRRRRVRTIRVTAGGAATAAAAAAVIALTGAAGGSDVLKPLPPALQPTPSTSPLHVPTDAAPSHELHAAAVGGSASGDSHPRGGSAGAASAAAVPTDARSSHASTSGTNEAPAVKLHVFRSTHAGSGTQICAGDVSGGTGSINRQGVGWCMFATAQKAAHGVRLTLSACRDDTTAGRLTYSSSREIDIAVKRGGRTVWNWAAGHPGAPSAHTRHAAANECWNWQLVWPDITQSGASAGHGQFTFVGTPTAQELAGYPPETIPFRY